MTYSRILLFFCGISFAGIITTVVLFNSEKKQQVYTLAQGTMPIQDNLEESKARGQKVYTTYCASCHQASGQGLGRVYPPLAGADYLMKDRDRAIDQILKGVSGRITVNGQVYNSNMVGIPLDNQQASDVVNYIRNSWGNEGEYTSPEDVEAVRNK